MGDLILTKDGKIFRIDYYLDIDRNSDVVGYQHKIGFIPLKLIKQKVVQKNKIRK